MVFQNSGAMYTSAELMHFSLSISCSCSPLCPGLLGTAQTDQQCSLAFYFRTEEPSRQNDHVVFTGLTAEEVMASGNTTIGHRLTCACTTIVGLKPRLWMGLNNKLLPIKSKSFLVDYKLADKEPGSAVHLRIHENYFSCTDAGTYTCVIGNNTRTVLVTPIGEYSYRSGINCVDRRICVVYNIIFIVSTCRIHALHQLTQCHVYSTLGFNCMCNEIQLLLLHAVDPQV